MSVMSTPYEQYKKQGVMMATPVELIVMLYSGCVKKLKLAQMAIDRCDYEEVNNNFKRAQDIVMELIMSLDLHYAISKDLMALYEYIYRRISIINASKDRQAVEPVINMLSGLRDTWMQVDKECKTKIPYETRENEI
ncbi:MAG: flagellar export chaperone FliS [Eubacteriales bacterium]|nr:flagellar export chaperone FliS [Eubacteriales bacterium]